MHEYGYMESNNMYSINVITNESFERYLDFLNRRDIFESRRRKLKREGRFDNLDLDDITADITAPTDGEIDDAKRELDLFDDIAIKTGASDVKVDSDGQLILLDLDPVGSPVYKHKEDDKFRELDFDETGKNVSKSKSNIGNAIGSLDYDDDIDTSDIAASIDDVYACLSSDDPRTVSAMIKRYSVDIKDRDKIRDAMLVQATNLNLPCLKILCGDMDIKLTAKEKKLGFIDESDISVALDKLKAIASTLTGANNTYGLIPNAIVACTQESQIDCMNVVDFLKEWCELPIIPLYFRGAMIRHCYDLASYLYDELDDDLSLDLFTGPKGIINRMKQLDDIPPQLMIKIASSFIKLKSVKSDIIGDMIIAMSRSGGKRSIKMILDALSGYKREFVIDYIDDTDASAMDVVTSLLD